MPVQSRALFWIALVACAGLAAASTRIAVRPKLEAAPLALGDGVGSAAPLPATPTTGSGSSAPSGSAPGRILVSRPECRSASNGCQICSRTAAGGVVCSTPGIACQPSEWRCD
jgi:hypothetical protein